MAMRRVCVVLAVWACTLRLHTNHAASTGYVKSPLDLSYILNDLHGELGGLNAEAAALGRPPPSSSGEPGGYVYPHGVQAPGGNRGGDDSDHIVLYANDVGDSEYLYKRGEPASSNLNNVPSIRYSAPGVVTGGGPVSSQEPREYVYPLYDDSGNRGGDADAAAAAAADAEKQLIRFGQNVQRDRDHHHYPIEIPALPPAPGHGGQAAEFPVQRRQILPNPYSNNVVPYGINSNDKYNAPSSVGADRQAIKHDDRVVPYVPQASLGNSVRKNDDYYSKRLPARPSLPSDASSAGFPDSLFLPPGSGSAVESGGLYADLERHPVAVDSSAGGAAVVPGGVGYDDGLVQQRVDPAGKGSTYHPVDVYQTKKELKCWPQFFFEYEHDFSGAVWQDVKGQVDVEQGRAVFKGQGFLAIPFFACNDLLPRYSMIFVISPSYRAGGSGPQAVLGNSVFSDRASLLLFLSGNTLTLVVRQRAPGLAAGELLSQCYGGPVHAVGADGYHKAQGSNPAGSVVHGDIVVLQLTIPSGEVTVTIAQENDWISLGAGDQHVTKGGRLPTLTNEALYVGAGADPRGGGALPHYTGTFDSFLFEKCP